MSSSSLLFARCHRASRLVALAALLVLVAGAQAGPAPLYISPNGFQVEIMPSFTRDRSPQASKNIEAAWNGPRRATLVAGTGPIPASITGPQLLQMAKAAHPRFYGKRARIVHAQTMTTMATAAWLSKAAP